MSKMLNENSILARVAEALQNSEPAPTLPDGVFGGAAAEPDIEISLASVKMAGHDISQILHDAHPKGSTKLDGLDAKSHDLEDARAEIMATLSDKKRARLVELNSDLRKLAGVLRTEGNSAVADRIEKLIKFIGA